MTLADEHDIRARFRRADLPAAPESLKATIAEAVASRPTGGLLSAPGRAAQLLLPAAAVLVIIAAAIFSGGPGPMPPGASDPGAGSGAARLVVKPAVYESCGPLGCAFHLFVDGPGVAWRGQLEFAELGEARPVTPAPPEILGSGRYTARAEIHVISDAVEEGETEGRDLGTSATCTAEFEVSADAQVVELTVGFWLDRCAVGAVATPDPGALASVRVVSTIEGVCGGAADGCEYRLTMSGPGGSWATTLRSPNPGSQIATSPELAAQLPAGTYRLQASAHRMSEEAEPGAGHRRELSAATACSGEFVIGPDTDHVDASVSFVDETCTIDARPQVLGTEPPGVITPGPTSGQPSYPVICSEYDVEGLRLTCQQAVDAALAELEEFDASISRMEFTHGCRNVRDLAGDCAAQLSGSMAVYRVGIDRFGQTDVLFIQGDGRNATAELVFTQSFQIFCGEEDAPALGCAEAVDAALRLGDFGPSPGPIANVTVAHFCDTTCEPAFRSVLVDLSFSSQVGDVQFTAYRTPEGLAVEHWPEFLSHYRPPYGEEPSADVAVAIEAVALRHKPTDVNRDEYTLTVEFFGNACEQPYEPWVRVDADRVRVAIAALQQPLPRPSGSCDSVRLYTYRMELPTPFAGTLVEDLSNGRMFEVEIAELEPDPIP